MLLALFKAPSAAVTVGYLSLGLTLPFAAAYREKSQPLIEKELINRNHSEGRIVDGRFGTHGSYCRL